MRMDWYLRGVLTVIAAALLAIAASAWMAHLPPSVAEAQAQMGGPKTEINVPKAWGKLISYSNGNLLLEAPDGTLRVVDIDGKPPEYPKLKVIVHWN